jgi:hypothetical protein
LTRRKQSDPELSAEVMTMAKVIASLRDTAQDLAFHGAAASLQEAVDVKDAAKETFWRQVFDGYTRVVARRGIRDMGEYHQINTASAYVIGDNPRRDPDPGYEQYAAEHYEEDMRRLTAPVPEADPIKEDDDIPF